MTKSCPIERTVVRLKWTIPRVNPPPTSTDLVIVDRKTTGRGRQKSCRVLVERTDGTAGQWWVDPEDLTTEGLGRTVRRRGLGVAQGVWGRLRTPANGFPRQLRTDAHGQYVLIHRDDGTFIVRYASNKLGPTVTLDANGRETDRALIADEATARAAVDAHSTRR